MSNSERRELLFMRALFFSLFTLGTLLAAAAGSGTNLSKTNLSFEPVRYRPIAAKVLGLKKNLVSLDGAWRIDPKPRQDVREKPLNAASWSNFRVPGQWAQQAYVIPRDRTAALAKEFVIPDRKSVERGK